MCETLSSEARADLIQEFLRHRKCQKNAEGDCCGDANSLNKLEKCHIVILFYDIVCGVVNAGSGNQGEDSREQIDTDRLFSYDRQQSCAEGQADGTDDGSNEHGHPLFIKDIVDDPTDGTDGAAKQDV